MAATTFQPVAPFESLQAPIVDSSRLVTAEEYAQMPEAEGSELIRGRVVPLMPPGEIHGDLQAALIAALRPFVRIHGLGRVYGEIGYYLERNPDVVRAPVVSFVQTSRLRIGDARRKYFEGAPDLAVEIVSPTDRWTDIEDKVRLYFQNETRMVWIIEPDSQTVTVRTSAGTSRVYTLNETLSGEDVLPGFELALSELFE